MVLNVGRTKMENGQEQSTTDKTTTKQNEVTFKNQCKQWNQTFLKGFDKSSINLSKPSHSILLNLLRCNDYPFFQFKIKTTKGHILIKYVVLFSIILVAVVLSTVLAGYFSTRNRVKDIPIQVKKDLQKMPEWEILKRLPSNLLEMKFALQLGKNILIVLLKTYST